MEVYKKMDCNKTNLRRGSKGEDVKTIQTLLTNFGYYTGRIDGIYGTYTEQAVKAYQKDKKLLADGIVGPVTCRALTGQNKNNNPTPTQNGDKTGIYKSIGHYTSQGCNKLGQCDKTKCAPHSIHQTSAKKDLENIADEYRLAGWAGTTSAGTGHAGIETAFYELSKRSGKKIKLEWKNLSDMGSTLTEQMRNIGRIIEQPDKYIFFHLLYRNQYGHYECVKEVNMNNSTLKVMNSLGNKCTSTSYCGYMETRSFKTQQQYIKGISQKSILIITFE
jgi:hypothetical protein